ncbi:MAG: ABC transporter substrate-binding protein, partial [Candidatus Margulisiibacteriota bacterium]
MKPCSSKKNKAKSRTLVIWISIFFVFGSSSAYAKAYDGIWFLGFNLHKPPFNNIKVRQAVAHSLDQEFIAKRINEEDFVPTSFIPKGMEGYDPELKPYKYNPSYAKKLMRQAKYQLNDPRLKNLTLLHTDGVKTIEIAKKIEEDLKNIGIKINRIQVSYREEERWNQQLALRKHHLFLMGYKTEIEKLFTSEATVSPQVSESYLLLAPLFKTEGAANFTGYNNPKVDTLLDEVSVIGFA